MNIIIDYKFVNLKYTYRIMIIIVPQMITFLIFKLQSKAGLRLSLSLSLLYELQCFYESFMYDYTLLF